MTALFKKNTAFRDLIFLSKESKNNALTSIIKNNKNNCLFIVSSFKGSLVEINNLLKKENIPYYEINSNAKLGDQNGIFLLDSKVLLSSPSFVFSKVASNNSSFVLLEHYPILEKDKKITKTIVSLFNTKDVCFFLSLEDDFFSNFDTGKIKHLAKQIGLMENDILEHKMITKSIIRYQKKISNKVKREISSPFSMKKWMEDNLI